MLRRADRFFIVVISSIILTCGSYKLHVLLPQCLLSERSIVCAVIRTFISIGCQKSRIIIHRLDDAHAPTFVYASTCHVHVQYRGTSAVRNLAADIETLEPCVHLQGYSARACNNTSQSHLPWNRICSSKTPNPQAAPAATVIWFCWGDMWADLVERSYPSNQVL